MVILISLFVVGWMAVVLLGSMTYFLGEQSKPIHARNWRSESFEKLAESITGTSINFTTRVPAFDVADAYASMNLPSQ